ncbi:MAG: hypothetical protein RLN75_05100 [Longimicrobiales bacterium]
MIRRTFAAVTLLALPALAGCAAGGASSAPDDRMTVGVGTREGEGTARSRGTITVSNTPSEASFELPAGLQPSWAALQATVTDLELPVSRVAPDEGSILVRGRLPRLDGKRMSTWFDCGTDVTGRVADRSRIDVALQFRLESVASDRTRVGFALQGTATPRFNSDNRIPCRTEHALVEFLTEEVAARLR